MSTKGDLSRKRILDAARLLFAEKGFSKVTMQDICTASGLSRGGLYRHYSSTAEVFSAIIRDEQAQAHKALEKAVASNISPRQIMTVFLRSRLAQLLQPKNCIDNAISEFAANSPEGKALLAERAAGSVKIFSKLLHMGVETGIFRCENCEATAIHILCLMEGLSKHNALLPLSQEDIETQMVLINRLFI